jgi:hypothetical protein
VEAEPGRILDFLDAGTHLGLPYESHRLRVPDRKGSTSEVQQ